MKPNYKRIFILVFCLALLAGIARIAIKGISSSSASSRQNEQHDKYPEVVVKTLTSATDGYTVRYPTLHIPKIDTTLSTYAAKKIANHQKRLANASLPSSDLNISYEIMHFSEQTVSILFTENSTKSSQLFTFDIPSQKRMTIDNLFKKNTDYLEILSNIASGEHSQTKPIKADFNQFIITGDILLFYMQADKDTDPSTPNVIAIKKKLFENCLIHTYKGQQMNKDKIQDTVPKHVISKIPDQVKKIDPKSRVIALTFDDGPSAESTDLILESLKKFNAHATFFVLGSRVQSHPKIIKKMTELGNEVGNHSWDHSLLTKLSPKKITRQVNKTQQIIKESSNYEPTLLRPPYGAFDHKVLASSKMDIALWDIDPEDWKIRNKEEIIQKVMSKADDGKVILMHDIYHTSAEAAEEIIRLLSEQNYQLVTVSELKEVQKQRKRPVVSS